MSVIGSEEIKVVVPDEVDDAALGPANYDARKRHRGAFRGVLGGGAPLVRRRVRRRGRIALSLSAFWVMVVLLLAIAANLLPLSNVSVPIGIPDLNPNWSSQFLGLDAVGRSTVSRLVFGARTSYLIAISVTAISLFIGCAIGLLAAYYRGLVDYLANLFCTVVLSIPGLLLLLTIAVVWKPSYIEVIAAIALVKLPGFIRVIQAIARSEIEKSYIVAARGMGASGTRIIVHELLPSTLVSVVTYAGVVLPTVMLTEGSMSYLGYGVPSPVASWGQMIASGQQNIITAPWQALIPAIVFAVNIFALYTLSDWLRARVGLRGIDKTL